ncbi:MAG TPA: hypothetical protein VFT98_00945, partial [Myxococcota bacterium]|nr:hypothetical protein [Myxococcota bacterium]
LPPAEFFARFPEGTYTITAKGIDGEKLAGESEISHVLPAAPGNVRINGVLAPTDCDEAIPLSAAPVVITWDPVTTSHPTLGEPGAVAIESYGVELEIDILDEEFSSTALLPPTVTSFQVSDTLLALVSGAIEFEILARDSNGNRSIVETCFDVQ